MDHPTSLVTASSVAASDDGPCDRSFALGSTLDPLPSAVVALASAPDSDAACDVVDRAAASCAGEPSLVGVVVVTVSVAPS